MPRKKTGPIVQALAIQAPVERVWAALTSPRDLGQLVLGRVEMRAEPGTAFSWQWGVWETAAPRGGPEKFTWKGKVLDVVPGAALVLGPEPLVTLTVKGQGGAALVTVVQPATPAHTGEDYEYGWADFLLHLKTNLEAEQAEKEVLVRALLKATPQQVYRAWLSAPAMAKIIPGKAKIKAKAGQHFSWQHRRSQHVNTGVFLELRKNKRLVFTWEGTRPASEVAAEAQPMPYGTLVSIHHTGLLRLNPGQLFGQRMFWARLVERMRCYFYFKGKIKTAD
ncbi:MAG: SRPBCC domain-containing protein [Terriglobia bacterium]